MTESGEMASGETVVLGITGGVAAYKAAEIASRLTKAGINVEVLMTEAATRLISAVTLHAVTHYYR